ncbi:glutathione synthetase [Emiliania huxleyi CCMP1516]|uniref:Glutathione synthetase n=2 Tax=Emiliania huxleyi TaxID=2903 RepID=A0A0D3JFQ6_EMIH1|nr:glutathione synthetase [Emiliania huxleyi CCMP1516]EOD22341.1 glutathione synthetase [Emiliania huxleyi CCMP1516]|eukprot:XP_005774770.1 glutathione synthetase [Emiliania huxleyi CCMP1516]
MADILASAGAQEDSSAPPETLLGLPASLVARMQSDTLAWQAVGGILIGAGASLLPAPCSLLPYPWPSELFEQSRALAVPFNALVDRVARDVDWLHAATRSVVKQDAFTGRLLQLSESVHAEGPTQPLQLGIYRSDYMMSRDKLLRQVELNTISSSFGSLSGKLSAMHAELLPRWMSETSLSLPAEAVPPREDAVFKPRGHCTCARPRVLMVVQPAERNVTDQRGIEACLWRSHGVPLVRMTMAEVEAAGKLSGPERRLLLPDGASVVYFRAGYTPNDYPTARGGWSGRELLERSHAIKCPSIGQHLAGTKKAISRARVQQLLADEAALARFAGGAEEAALLRTCFAGLYGLDEGEDAACAAGLPALIALRLVGGGGGNNLFDEELAEALRTMGEEERSGYILMERIRPPTAPAVLMKGGQLVAGECAAELGVYGVFLGDGQRTVLNRAAGHLLRVKQASVNEGGVVAGFAALSSPLLFP